MSNEYEMINRDDVTDQVLSLIRKKYNNDEYVGFYSMRIPTPASLSLNFHPIVVVTRVFKSDPTNDNGIDEFVRELREKVKKIVIETEKYIPVVSFYKIWIGKNDTVCRFAISRARRININEKN